MKITEETCKQEIVKRLPKDYDIMYVKNDCTPEQFEKMLIVDNWKNTSEKKVLCFIARKFANEAAKMSCVVYVQDISFWYFEFDHLDTKQDIQVLKEKIVEEIKKDTSFQEELEGESEGNGGEKDEEVNEGEYSDLINQECWFFVDIDEDISGCNKERHFINTNYPDFSASVITNMNDDIVSIDIERD